MEEVYDGSVKLKVKGANMLQWDYPTPRECAAICQQVHDMFCRGAKVEHFEISRNLDYGNIGK